MSRKQDVEGVRRKPFDLQEAVVLLDVYLSYNKKGATNTEASEVASQRLRELARKRGMIIDDSFRSAMGIQNRLRSIGHIFEGKESASVPGTQVFREAVDLYKNDLGRYRKLLEKTDSDPKTPNKDKRKASIKKTKFGSSRKDQIFYDKKLEERKRKQMEDSLKAAKQEFFSWLPSAVSLSAVEEITRSYRSIGAMLVQKKALSQSLFATTQIEQVEVALRLSKKVFGSKKTRNTSQKLLTAYITYLREKKNTVSVEKSTPDIAVQEDWIRFDFTNSKQFEYTVPAYVAVKGQQFEGRNWTRILVGITEQELKNDNHALKSLYKHSLIENRKDRPYFLKEKLEGLNCSELSNGYWLNVNYSIPCLLDQIRALCLHCGYIKTDVVIYGVDKNSSKPKSAPAVPKVSGHRSEERRVGKECM